MSSADRRRGALGGKVSAGHTTLTPECGDVVRLLGRIASVARVVPGKIFGKAGTDRPRLLVEAIMGGLKVTVRGRHAKQEVYAWTSDPDAVRAALEGMKI